MELTSDKDRIVFADLESYVRERAQAFIQSVLEEEVNELLGRDRHTRREYDSPAGYRNGHGKDRRLSTSIGTVTLRRPRVRDCEEQFVSRVLPLFAKRTEQIGELLPQLYLHGLASGDFELAMRGLLGDAAPIWAQWISRCSAGKVKKNLNGTLPCGASIVAPTCSGLTVSSAAIVSAMPFRSIVSACSSVAMLLIADWIGPRNSSRLPGNLPALMIDAKPPL